MDEQKDWLDKCEDFVDLASYGFTIIALVILSPLLILIAPTWTVGKIADWRVKDKAAGGEI